MPSWKLRFNTLRVKPWLTGVAGDSAIAHVRTGFSVARRQKNSRFCRPEQESKVEGRVTIEGLRRDGSWGLLAGQFAYQSFRGIQLANGFDNACAVDGDGAAAIGFVDVPVPVR
jgi:hypothetical protein